MDKVFVSWSGGKDSAFALHRARQLGMEVACLLNMVTLDGSKSWSHQIAAEHISVQARAMDIPLVQCRTSSSGYEQAFTDTLKSFGQRGIKGGVFGDIDFEPHREWIEKVCGPAGIKPYLPLWGLNQGVILHDFIKAGFKSVVVVARSDFFDERILGRTVDDRLYKYFRQLGVLNGLTPCGEAGEYHTFVVDGPPFKLRVTLHGKCAKQKDGYRMLEIQQCGLREKNG